LTSTIIYSYILLKKDIGFYPISFFKETEAFELHNVWKRKIWWKVLPSTSFILSDLCDDFV